MASNNYKNISRNTSLTLNFMMWQHPNILRTFIIYEFSKGFYTPNYNYQLWYNKTIFKTKSEKKLQRNYLIWWADMFFLFKALLKIVGRDGRGSGGWGSCLVEIRSIQLNTTKVVLSSTFDLFSPASLFKFYAYTSQILREVIKSKKWYVWKISQRGGSQI